MVALAQLALHNAELDHVELQRMDNIRYSGDRQGVAVFPASRLIPACTFFQHYLNWDSEIFTELKNALGAHLSETPKSYFVCSTIGRDRLRMPNMGDVDWSSMKTDKTKFTVVTITLEKESAAVAVVDMSHKNSYQHPVQEHHNQAPK